MHLHEKIHNRKTNDLIKKEKQSFKNELLITNHIIIDIFLIL